MLGTRRALFFIVIITITIFICFIHLLSILTGFQGHVIEGWSHGGLTLKLMF
jgi:hypothetical protein